MLDAALHQRACDAGAVFRNGRASSAIKEGERILGFALDDGREIRAEMIVGADGALSRVANAAGLVDHHAVLWGYALRSYVPGSVSSPMIVTWEPNRLDGYPGFGWLFPSLDGNINVGLGIGTLADRTASRRVMGEFNAFIRWCVDHGVLGPEVLDIEKTVTGAWLKMGVVGTRPVKDNVLLVGEAAGLTNPLTGEGISQAITSGAMAGQLLSELGAAAAPAYVDLLKANFLPYNLVAAAIQRQIVSRPGAAFRTTRLLTRPRLAGLVGGPWSMFWNDLSRGARPGPDRLLARLAERLGVVLTARTTDRAWFKLNELMIPR